MTLFKQTLLVSALASVGVAGSASAGVVGLTNADFETGAVVDSGVQEVPGWFDFRDGGGDLIQGEVNSDMPDDSNGIGWLNLVDRENFGSDSATATAGVYQTFGTHDAGITSYDVTLTLGLRKGSSSGSVGFDTVIVELYAGAGTGADGANIASVTGLALISSFTLEEADYFPGSTPTGTVVTDTISLSAAGISAGETLWLSLRTDDDYDTNLGTQQALVDDISITAVPEPGSLALLGLGGLLIGARRRRNG